jgi:hypothetical protein
VVAYNPRDYERNNIRHDLQYRKDTTEAYKQFLENNGLQMTRQSSYNKAIIRGKKLQEKLDKLQSLDNELQFLSTLVDETNDILGDIQEVIGDVDLKKLIGSSSIINQQIQELDKQAKQVADQTVQMSKNILHRVFNSCKSLFGNVNNNVNVFQKIPLEQIFGIFTYGFSELVENFVSGGILQIINLSILILHYLIMLFTSSTAAPLRATLESLQENQRIRRETHLARKLPPIAKLPPLQRGGVLPLLGVRGFAPQPNASQQLAHDIGMTIKNAMPTILASNNFGKSMFDVDLYAKTLEAAIMNPEKINMFHISSQIDLNVHAKQIYDGKKGGTLPSLPFLVPSLNRTPKPNSNKIEIDNLVMTATAYPLFVQKNHTLEELPLQYPSNYNFNDIENIISDSITEDIKKQFDYIIRLTQSGGKRSKLRTRDVQEINIFLSSIPKNNLYTYTKVKQIGGVTSNSSKSDIISAIIRHKDEEIKSRKQHKDQTLTKQKIKRK